MNMPNVLVDERQILVLRVSGEQREGSERGLVCYVPFDASPSTVASHLRIAADRLDKP
jgi:hypothetical protein